MHIVTNMQNFHYARRYTYVFCFIIGQFRVHFHIYFVLHMQLFSALKELMH